jgi:hypothetical protein
MFENFIGDQALFSDELLHYRETKLFWENIEIFFFFAKNAAK